MRTYVSPLQSAEVPKDVNKVMARFVASAPAVAYTPQGTTRPVGGPSVRRLAYGEVGITVLGACGVSPVFFPWHSYKHRVILHLFGVSLYVHDRIGESPCAVSPYPHPN